MTWGIFPHLANRSLGHAAQSKYEAAKGPGPTGRYVKVTLTYRPVGPGGWSPADIARLAQLPILLFPAWHNRLGPRLVKAPKLLIGDVGLLCRLLHFDRKRLLEDYASRGLVLEGGWH